MIWGNTPAWSTKGLWSLNFLHVFSTPSKWHWCLFIFHENSRAVKWALAIFCENSAINVGLAPHVQVTLLCTTHYRTIHSTSTKDEEQLDSNKLSTNMDKDIRTSRACLLSASKFLFMTQHQISLIERHPVHQHSSLTTTSMWWACHQHSSHINRTTSQQPFLKLYRSYECLTRLALFYAFIVLLLPYLLLKDKDSWWIFVMQVTTNQNRNW